MKKSQARSFLAIEFASSGVKFVKMTQSANRFDLVDARFVPVSLERDPEKQAELWKAAASEMLAGEDVKSEPVLLVVNTTQTCFAQFTLPKLPKKELEGTLKWKMKDQLPFPVEEAVLDYRLSEPEKIGKQLRCQSRVCAVPKSVVDRYSKVLSAVGCREIVLVSSIFSISSLASTLLQAKPSLVAVVDIGHSMTEIALYAAGRLSFLRKISFGGEVVNTCLTQSLVTERGTVSLTHEEAERAKQTESLFDPMGEHLIAAKVEASKLHSLIRPELERFIDELKRSFHYYAEEHGDAGLAAARVVEHVFLTGGTSRLGGMCEYLEERLDIPTQQIQLENELAIQSQARVKDLSPFYRLIAAVLDHPYVPASYAGHAARGMKRVLGKLSYKVVAIACALFLVAVGWILDFNYRRIVHARQDLRAQVDNLIPGYEAAQNIRSLERKLERAQILMSAILEKEPLWLELFKELSHSFPPEAVLESVTYGEGILVVKGRIDGTGDKASVSDLALAMEWPIFRNVNIVRTEQREDATYFEIRCLLS
ncbi:MAG: hypothetical protein A3G87_08240 [Omnitrophica bacterium RIFCSPLOWO2_12_FULL_50_11]|nr:MAG: hypothetical protein A3G87_08240 [Omnitrophica bacterium RIFCSPLOWO2_12_FULL_50_11]